MLKILVFSDTYLPGYKGGGPVKSVKNMISSLASEFDFWIITRDRDLGDKRPYPDIKKNQWTMVENSKVYYATPDQLTIRNIVKIIEAVNFDVLYINSFFNFSFSIKPLLAIKLNILNDAPVIVAPRGEFSPGALQIKVFKKKIFIVLSKLIGLHRKIYWQATTEIEKDDIVNAFGVKERNVTVAKNLPSQIAESSESIVTDSSVRAVFLSRISPKKNLDFALQVLSKSKAKIKFDIYGPIEDKTYWQSCLKLIASMPDNISVNYCGEVMPAEVSGVFSNYDLFVFPTRGENYGHVIAEALSVGTPVMLSDQTPWRALESDGLGWDIPLDDFDYFVKSIDAYSHKLRTDRKAIREHVLNGAHKRIFNSEDLEASKNMFLAAVAR